MVFRLTHSPASPLLILAACYQDIISHNQYSNARAIVSMRLPPKSPDRLISTKDCVAETAGLFDRSASWLSGRDAEQLRNLAVSIRKELEVLRTFFNSGETNVNSYVRGSRR